MKLVRFEWKLMWRNKRLKQQLMIFLLYFPMWIYWMAVNSLVFAVSNNCIFWNKPAGTCRNIFIRRWFYVFRIVLYLALFPQAL